MKKSSISSLLSVAVIIGAGLCATARSQSTSVAPPPISGTAAEVLKLSQANITDDTILAYLANSRTACALNADQIIYLKKEGVSAAVLNAMLAQPKSSPATVSSTATTVAQPATTVVQTVPATTYYYYNPYYYPAYYGWGYPAISFSWGWGGGWHGGWRGGWHR